MLYSQHLCQNPEPVRLANTNDVSIELLPCAAYSVSYTSNESGIGFAFDSQKGTHALGTDRRHRFYRPANSLALVPAGCDVFSESEQGGEYLRVLMSPERLSMINNTQPSNPTANPHCITIAQTVRRHLIGGVVIEALQLDELCESIIDNLSTSIPSRVSPFNKQQLRNLEEFIDAHLTQNLTVATLSQVIPCSVGHFSRRFKASLGTSPFDYVIQRRLTHARQYIRHTQRSLGDIALLCGFTSHAHMSMVFRKSLGISPSQLRKE
ncbi:hypothetical protein NBRC116591_38280 [Sessilibacter corallicola]|uniref:HTH araC/xylS-type domain-containing protein n=1 Tax=Sessilibacter corallicola TaxID=2904075 RepID=A0ABQ0AED3_9GAMM